MIKKIYICLFLAISFLNGYAQKRTNIDDNWLFHYGNSENAKEDFMDSVFKNMEKEYTDLGNPENADFSRGGGKAKMLMNDMRKKFF